MLPSVWNLEDLQSSLSLQAEKLHSSQQITQFIQNLLATHGSCPRNGILLPSLKHLMDVFECSYKDIQDALQKLEPQGYQASFPGLYGHISLFKTSSLN